MAEFPRGTDLPKQTPLFWVAHKDRYLRQLLIRDIQDQTGRDLIVYFTDCDRTEAQIDQGDDAVLVELLNKCGRKKVDLLLETNGGFTDATEKVCHLLRALAPDLRVIVPRRAKSNGTSIALCGQSIELSATSELGPIDPYFNGAPVEVIINAPANTFNAAVVAQAKLFLKQTKKLATELLTTGMMKGKTAAEIEKVVNQLATRDKFHSHGSIINATEAKALGLAVNEYPSSDALWQKFWLLRTMYAYDCGLSGHSKIFEGEFVSSAVATTKAPPKNP